MSLPLRILLLAVVLVGGVTALSWLLGEDQPQGTNSGANNGVGDGTEVDPATGQSRPIGNETGAPQWTSSKQCQACHPALYAEWEGSHHQIAYLNPEVRKLSDDFKNKECQACHLPRPVAQTGFGKRVLPRFTQPDEGVSCLSCHLDAEGRVMGKTARPDVGCQPVANPEYATVKMCSSCHNQHQTTDQWHASPQAAEGTTCNSCHMPETTRVRDGGISFMGRGHTFPGAHDLETLRSAGKFVAELADNGRLALQLTNDGAGHNFPTEERHRAVDMMYRFVTADGATTEWEQAYRFRSPYRDEVGENTQLPAGESKRVEVDIPAGTQRAEARLWYRLTPYVTDDDPHSSLLEERTVEIE